MTVTATAPLGKMLTQVAGYISQSAKWQSITGTANAAAALARITWPMGDFESLSRPFCVVTPVDVDEQRLADLCLLPTGGQLFVYLGIDNDLALDSGEPGPDNWVTIDNAVGTIIQQVKDSYTSDTGAGYRIESVKQYLHKIASPKTRAKASGVTASK